MEVVSKHMRQIRSFILRTGRLTKGQEKALEEQWVRFGIREDAGLLDFEQIFGRKAPVTLEIGFGNGTSLAEMAKNAPERDFIGIEVHTPGIGHLLYLIDDWQLSNVRVMHSDAVPIVQNQIAADSLDRVQLYFPDPWHKRRHNKRRIVQPPFVSLLASRLQLGGVFHMATDWESYAKHMAGVMEDHEAFECLFEQPFAPRPDERPLTKFEKRGLDRGHGVWDLLYQRVK